MKAIIRSAAIFLLALMAAQLEATTIIPNYGPDNGEGTWDKTPRPANNFATSSTPTTIVIYSELNSLMTGKSAIIAFTLSDASTDFAVADITVSGGAITELAATGLVRTAIFTAGSSATTARISVAAGVFTSVAGSRNIASNTLSIAVQARAADFPMDIDTLSVLDNGSPQAVWSDGTTLWVSDADDDKLYAYTLSTMARDPSEDFNTLAAAGNNTPRGIWSDGATMWVADAGDAGDASDNKIHYVGGVDGSSDDKIYAYNMTSKARDASKDIDALGAAGNNHPYGIWSDGTTMWVADWSDEKIYAYSMASKAHDAINDFGTLHNSNRAPRGLWSDGTTLWVADHGTFSYGLFAYSLATKMYDRSKTFPDGVNSDDPNTLRDAGNRNPWGIWSDGTTMWVVDFIDSKLYAYALASKMRTASKDLDTLSVADNGEPVGLWSDGTTMWVSDLYDAKIYAYDLTTRARDPDKDFNTLYVKDDDTFVSSVYNFLNEPNNHPTGIWSDGATMWVNNAVHPDLIFPYNLTTKARDLGKHLTPALNGHITRGMWSDGTTLVWDVQVTTYPHTTFPRVMGTKWNPGGTTPDRNAGDYWIQGWHLETAGNDHPYGIWSDGTTMWVSDYFDAKIYAYLPKGGYTDRNAIKDFDTLKAAGNNNPRGIWSDGTTMWVVDVEDDKLYAYNLSDGSRVTADPSEDTIPPTITISGASSLTTGATTSIILTTSEATTDFALTDITVSGGTLSGFIGSGVDYTVAFTADSSPTTARITVGAGAFTDAAGNDNVASNVLTIAITPPPDTTAPTIAITGAGSLTTGEATIVTFTINESTADFVRGDITVSGGTLAGFAGAGASYTVVFTADSSPTTARISVSAGAFTDAAGNGNTASNVLVITVAAPPDNTPPTITLTGASNLIVGATTAITLAISETTTNFAEADITVSGGTLASFAGAGAIYTAAFTASSSPTTASISVGAGAFTDAAGNSNTASNVLTIAVTNLPLDAAPMITVGPANGTLLNLAGTSSVTLSGTTVWGALVTIEVVEEDDSSTTVDADVDGINWTATLDLSGMSEGALTIVVTATRDSKTASVRLHQWRNADGN